MFDINIDIDSLNHDISIRYFDTLKISLTSLFVLRPGPELPHQWLQINGVDLNFLLDTGSTISTIDEATYQKWQHCLPQLQRFTDQIQGYPEQPLAVVGQFAATVVFGVAQTSEIIAVVAGKAVNLLSYRACLALDLVTINTQASHTCSTVKSLPDQYPNLFKSAIGRLTDITISLRIDPTIEPVVQKPRHTPYHLRDKIEAKLAKLVKDGVIRKAKGPIAWVSSIVPILKPNGDVRITTDSRAANAAIQRTRHPMPTPDDISMAVTGATVFSKLDIKESFYILELSEESKYITVFRTHLGLFEFNCLNMGINTATEIFQKTLEDILRNHPNCKNLIDDVLIWGRTQAEHDQALHKVLATMNARNFTLNADKCQFSVSTILFFGLELSANGVRVTEDKTRALREASIPEHSKDILSFMGLAQFCAKQIPNLATTAKPITLLTRETVKWEWTDAHTAAFNAIKASIIDKAMGHFNKLWHTSLFCDASPVGLGCILWQTGPPPDNTKVIIKCDSRTLSDVEQRYSQQEKEGLATVWACEKNEVYLIGYKFDLITDNKGIELIFKNPKSKPPPRIQRMRLRLSPFDFNIIHKPGTQNISDYLSRHPLHSIDDVQHARLYDTYAIQVARSLVPNCLRLDDLQQATDTDPTLQLLAWYIKHRREISTSRPLQPYRKVFNQLSVAPCGKLILKDQKLLIPSSLRPRIVQLAHQGHQGLVKTKRLLRSKVWFPGIDQAVEEAIAQCRVCNLNAPQTCPEPLSPTEMPDTWTTVALDHKNLPNGKHALIMIDVGSRYAIVHEVASTSMDNNIRVLSQTWTQFGAPSTIVSDNGPPFNGEKFRQHLNNFGILHRKTTPAWPRANGEAERFIRNVSKSTKTATANRTPPIDEIYAMLRAYNATPHSSTGVAPASLMFNRTHVNTSMLPEWTPPNTSQLHTTAKDSDTQAKAKQKFYYDRRNRTTACTLKIGDRVLFDSNYGAKIRNKAFPRFDEEPYTITAMKGAMITASNPSKTVTRNKAHFRSAPRT